MEKKSFVFHFEYIADIPEDIRGQWALYIIDYAQCGIEPAFSSWMEQKLWNSIKVRIDSECQEYSKKVANLRQNSKKNLHSLEKRLSDTEKQLSETEKALSDTDKALSETENQLSDIEKESSDSENAFSGGVYVNVNDYVNVYDNVSEFVNVNEHESSPDADTTNQPTFNIQNIKSTFSELGYSLDEKTISNISKSLSDIGISFNPKTLKYAYSVVSSKFYGKGAEKQKFMLKSHEEQKRIFISALLKYPADIFADYKAHLESIQKARIKSDEDKAWESPPKICKCGGDLLRKGSGLMCFDCRRTYEIKNGVWEVNE